MRPKTSFKTVLNILIAVYVVFVLAMAAWCIQGYRSAQKALGLLEAHRTSLARLNTEIENTKRSVDSLKMEQEEFKGLLFSDRDVPSFLDSISQFAQKNKVSIMEMKTERFNQIPIPKDMEGTSNIERRRAYGDDEDQPKPNAAAEFKNMLTLAAMPIHIKIQGTFGDIVHFLNSIENERQLLTVSNVEIDRSNDYPQLNCEFNLKIYSLQLLNDIKI